MSNTIKRAWRVVGCATLGGIGMGVACAIMAPNFHTGVIAFVLMLVGVIAIWQMLEDLAAISDGDGEGYNDPLYNEPDYVEEYLRVRRDPPRKAGS